MFGEFIQADEQGSVSLRKIGWLLGFCTVVGAVIDTSAAVHSKTKLEAVVDASSHRGTIDSFPFPHDSHHSAATPVDVNANGDRDGRG